MVVIYILTILLVAASVATDRRKTARALRMAARRFLGIAPAFLLMLVLVAVVLVLMPEEFMLAVLAPAERWRGVAAAVGVGSVSVMPGFVAFPLCGVLLERGALYMVLSAFSTTLMMVGVATFPLESSYLGTRLALLRNLGSLVVAIAVAVVTGLVFGEMP